MSLNDQNPPPAPAPLDDAAWILDGMTIVIPPFSAEQTKYIDERKRLAAEVDELEAIGGCSDRRASLDRRRHT